MTILLSQSVFATYVSTHMPLARHDFLMSYHLWNILVSTHMPLARHDYNGFPIMFDYLSFYSHASCEAWQDGKEHILGVFGFYSHASCEAWLSFNRLRHGCGSFYSHASCEAWLNGKWHCVLFSRFLLTCLLRGMTRNNDNTDNDNRFLLTCLLRGMTEMQTAITSVDYVSTHMPLARHDQ